MPSPPVEGRSRPTRGPQRPLTASPAQIDRWVAAARRRGAETEQARRRMQAAAVARQGLIARLHDTGLSVREIADAIGVSPAVISHALLQSRREASA